MLMLKIQLKQKLILRILIGYLDKDIRSLVLIVSETSGYVKTFKVEDIPYKYSI